MISAVSRVPRFSVLSLLRDIRVSQQLLPWCLTHGQAESHFLKHLADGELANIEERSGQAEISVSPCVLNEEEIAAADMSVKR